ncbi:CLIP-associated protein-like isoform X5 [Zingiber officinale]|uniref:CLIP-associated protein-like isoform X5 n=1 Tax=Zingiber officinale TaxID=94328 RepID=UPI001C4AB042|nr:CLIP-associated protein-like isoform X5 [Zingiber officinale]
MEVALEMVRVKDAKERMAGVERLRQVLEATTRGLSAGEVTALVDACIDLLKDSNFRVSQGALQSLSAAAVLSGENLKVHFNGLVPAVVERLGDGKQSVRDAARQLLITLMEVSSPTIIVERVGSYAWTHRSWRVREEFARTVTTAIRLFASTELPLQRVLLPPVLQLLNDSNQGVREAATSCIEEMYAQVGPQFREELHRHHLPSSMIKEINARLEQIQPKPQPSDRVGISYFSTEIRPSSANHKKNSPKAKIAHREISVSSGDNDSTEKPVVPINVFSEKELIKEIENIASTLVPEKDWSFRIAAMQKVEGLVFGGAADYTSFPTHLKQLIVPLNTQLLDRRSSIVKQACHLLRLLSKELMDDFEACAEIFIPVLMKLVVITVLVIAESADNCIKTMLRNCKVARVLPRIADAAKNDKSAVLRARCCEYALLILEYWADAPELQRSADLYEDLIKCCVADAMSENKKERQRSKSFYDQSNVGTSEEGYVGGIHCAYYSACSVDGEGERKRTSTEQLMQFDVYTIHATSDESHHPSQNVDACTSDPSSQGRLVTNSLLKTNYSIEHENSLLTPRLDVSELISCDGHKTIDMNHVSEVCRDPEMNHNKLNFSKSNLEGDMGPSIPGLLHQICNVNDASSSSEKCDTLQQLAEISLKNDNSVWAKYFDQILTAVLEVFDHSDPLMRELALSVIVRMLDNQKSAMEDSIDVVTEKLIHASKDEVAKVSNEANQCLNIILTRFDPYKFLSVIVPLLVSNDEKSLVICINCLTKIVGRLPQEDLMQHLPSFLPALFDAFGNQSPDLRKTVVFGLVEIYIILGKSFVPYLEGLSSTQLRLVTIYANRISQARSGASLNSCH